MALVTWTATFTLHTISDSPEEIAASLNGLIGGSLQRGLRPLLDGRGWKFGEAFPEDHGWDAEAEVLDAGKSVGLILVTSPELDGKTSDGHALSDRWRIVVGMDVGLFAKTKTRRLAILRALAADADACCRQLGAADLEWEVGGPK